MDSTGIFVPSPGLPRYELFLRGNLVERMIPAWGLYRLFNALEKRGNSGLLTLHFPDGSVRFVLKQGVPTDCSTDVDGLSFAEFLVQAGMVQDRTIAESFKSVDQLVEAKVVRAEDSKRFYNAYVRNVVDILLPAPVQTWMFEPSEDVGRASSSEAVDMCAELFTAVQRNADVSAMRVVVSRLGPFARVNDGIGQGCLTHARAHFRGAPLVAELVSGHCPPLTPALLADETNIRIIFGFTVAGGLVSAASGAGQLSDVPVSTVSRKASDVDFDEFRVSSVRPAIPPEPSKITHTNESLDGPPDDAHEEALDLAIDPGVRGHGRNFSRDDYLIMSDDGSIQGFSSAGQAKRESVKGMAILDPELDKAIQAELARAARLNHYELLEIAPEARVSAVRMAVLRARRRYSPSRYEGGVSPDTMKSLQGLIDRINKVGDIFSDLKLRVSYNRSQNISTPGLEAQLAAMFEARGFWREGMELLEQRKAAEALELFEAAENCDAEEPEYFCAQGMALLAMAPATDTYETIESLLDVAFSFDADLVGAHLLAADYMVRKNDFEAAQSHIRKVLALDPESREARAFRVKAKASKAAGQVNFKKKQESLLQKAINLIKR